MKYLRILLLVIAFTLVGVYSNNVLAQCPMCKMTAESNMKNGGTAGAGLNAGILYMLVAPYLIVGALAFWWWKNRKTEDENTADEWLNDPAQLN
jgi:hypothetical protein